jgi:hypothetical protein
MEPRGTADPELDPQKKSYSGFASGRPADRARPCMAGHESVLLPRSLEKVAECSVYAPFGPSLMTFARLITAWCMCIVQSSERGIPLLYNRVSCAWSLPGQVFFVSDVGSVEIMWNVDA